MYNYINIDRILGELSKALCTLGVELRLAHSRGSIDCFIFPVFLSFLFLLLLLLLLSKSPEHTNTQVSECF